MSLQARVAAVAAQLANAPQQAIKFAKSLLRCSAVTSIGEQFSAERDAVEKLVASADFEEGVHAFMAKREASFASCANLD